jgi:hypothetical protein
VGDGTRFVKSFWWFSQEKNPAFCLPAKQQGRAGGNRTRESAKLDDYDNEKTFHPHAYPQNRQTLGG